MTNYDYKVNDNLIFLLNNYILLQDGSNRKKINKGNNKLNKLLNITKDKISKYYENNCSWDKLKKFSNEYEFIYTSSYINDYKNISNFYPVSRSFFKLWEILYDFKYLIPLSTENLKTAHIAEGPGGFIECICKYLSQNNINAFTEIHGITLLSTDRSIPNWKIKKQLVNKYNIKLNDTDYDDGNLYKFENINRFINNVSETSDNKNCCDFITADGGFDFSNNYNDQEKDFIIFLICEIYIILNLLKKNANAVVKIYDIYSKNSIKILYILNLFFENIFIVKPLSSRPANSEKYLLCKSFNYENNLIKKYNDLFKNIILTQNLDLLNNENASYKFIKLILNYNKFYTDRQIKYINKTISLIEDSIKDNFDEKSNLKKIYNENTKHAIEWCKYYNIEIKQCFQN